MPEELAFEIELPSRSVAEQNRLAADLQQSLQAIPTARTELKRANVEAQDIGTIISVVLAGPAVIAAVKTLGAWLTRHNQTSLRLKLADSDLVLENVRSEDVAKAIEALRKARG